MVTSVALRVGSGRAIVTAGVAREAFVGTLAQVVVVLAIRLGRLWRGSTSTGGSSF